MQSGQLNAAQFLMSYMDTEQGKLGKKITSSGFSQQLKTEQSKLNRNVGDIPEGLEEATSGQSASGIETVNGAACAKSTIWGGRETDSDTDSFGNRALQKKASPKAKEKVKENLAFGNPMAVERIIAQFQVPAEARQACMSASDADGRIPLTAISSVLTQKAGPGQPNAAKTQIAAQDVRSLLNSLQNVHPEQSAQLPKLEAKQSGSYTIEEFRELLDRITQQIADTESVKQASTGHGTSQQARATLTATPEPGEAANPSANISPDQVERLAASVIPSFTRDEMATKQEGMGTGQGKEASSSARISPNQAERLPDPVIPSFSRDELAAEPGKEGSPSVRISPDQVEHLTDSIIPSFSRDEMTVEPGESSSSPTRISSDQVERLTSSVIPSFSRDEMAAKQEGMGTGPVSAQPEPAAIEVSSRVAVQTGQEEMGTTETTETEEMVRTSLKDPQPMEESHRELRHASGTTTRVNGGIEQQSSQPSPRAANTIQPAPERPVENAESAGRILQVETSGQGSAVANGPSVNLAASLAPVVDGKVTVIHRSIEESTFNSSSDEIAGTDGASSGETKISASQEPNGAGRQNSRESTGQGSRLSSHEKSQGFIAADQTVREDVSTAQQNFVESNAAAPQEIEAQNTDQVIDNHVSDSKAQDDPITASGKDRGGFTRDGEAAREQGSAFAGRDQGSPTASSGQTWDPSIQRPRETVHTTFTASPTGTHSSGDFISLEHPSWPENLSQRLHQLKQEGRSRMTLEVEPRDMGRLSLRIETQQNQVIAYISTDNEQTRALLMQHASDLRQHLQDQGLQLGQFSVEVRKDGSGNRNGYQRKGPTAKDSAKAQTVRGSDADGASAMAAAYVRRAGEQTISLFA